MKLFYDGKKRTLWQKIKYIAKHPWSIKYWWEEVGLGIRNVFRKNSARMIIALCASLLGILFIIAVFFYNLGKFVVTVDPALADQGFVLSTDDSFSDLRYKLFSEAIEDCNNISINDLPLNLDEGEGAHNGDNYLAYSFYIRNEGSKTLGYEYSVNLGERTKGLEYAAWIMIYQNGRPIIYAMPRGDGTPERQYSYDAFPLVEANDSLKAQLRVLGSDNRGYLTAEEQQRLGVLSIPGLTELQTVPFVDENTVLTGIRSDINPGEADKYTVVIWLEGEDPECIDDIKGGIIEYNMVFETLKDTEE